MGDPETAKLTISSGGELRKAIGSATGEIDLQSGGIINAEIDPEWVEYSTTPYTSAAADYNNIYVVTDKTRQVGDEDYELEAGEDYDVVNPFANVSTTHLRRITGIEAEAATATTRPYGYYGYVEKAYYAVTEVVVMKGILVIGGQELTLYRGAAQTLTYAVLPANPEDAVNRNATWSLGNPSKVAHGITFDVQEEDNSLSISALAAPLSALRDTIVITTVENSKTDSVFVKLSAIESITLLDENGEELEEPVELIGNGHGATTITVSITPTGASTSGDITYDKPDKVTSVPVAGHDGQYTLTAAAEVTEPEDVVVTFTSTAEPTASASLTIRILPVPVTGISEITAQGDQTEMEAWGTEEKQTLQLSANVLPEDAANQAITWESSAPDVADVDEATGLVTALTVSEEPVIITATTEEGDFAKTYELTVKELAVTSVEVSQSSLGQTLLYTGTTPEPTTTLMATVVPAKATNPAVEWTVKPGYEAYAEITLGGVVTPKWIKEEVVFVATSVGNPAAKVEATLTIAEAEDATITHVEKVEFAAETPTQLAVGAAEPVQLAITLTPENPTQPAVSYRSLRENIATVTSDGLLTPVAKGTALIEVTTLDGNHSATAEIAITQPATAITLTDEAGEEVSEALTLGAGRDTTIIAIPYPEDADDVEAITWTIKSSDPADAEVVILANEIGEEQTITANAQGEAVIKVTAGSVTKELTVTVTDATITDIEIAGNTALTIEYGEEDGAPTPGTSQLELVFALNIEGAQIPAHDTLWTSSDEKVATVDAATGKVTAVAEGEATISVSITIGDEEVATDEVVVTVTDNKPVPVIDLTFTVGSGTLYITHADGVTTYGEQQLSATVNVEPAWLKDHTTQSWNSSNIDTATVDDNGLVKAVGPGKTTITFTVNVDVFGTIHTKTQTVDFTVTDIPEGEKIPEVTGVTIEVAGDARGDSLFIEHDVNVTTYPELTLAAVVTTVGDPAPDYTIAWSATPANVVALTPNDKGDSVTVKAEAEGDAIIYAIVTWGDNQSKTAIHSIAVTEVDLTAPAAGVTINADDTVKVQKGEKLQLYWTIEPANALNTEVTWETYDPTIATVDSGLITALVDGETKIIVHTEEGDYTDTVVVVVYTVHPESVTISGAEAINLQKTKTQQLRWSVAPANANNTDVTWESLDEAVATVSDSGFVTAAGDGETQIVVHTVDGALTDTIDVSVYSIPITGIRIANRGNLPALQMTKTLQLTAQALPTNANDYLGVTWRSYDLAIATVDKNGVVTGVSVGDSAMIVATAVGTTFRDTVYIKVFTIDVEGITIDGNTGVAEIAIREKLPLHATVEPLNATNQAYTWKSDNTAVATVDKDGLVTGVAAGEANIVVTSAENKDYTDTLRLTVYKIDVESITIDNMPDSLAVGSSVELVASVEPSAPTDTVVTWRSGDEAIAKVDAAGKVTGVSAGETYIIAASDGKQDSLTLKVYVEHVTGVTIAAAGSVAVNDTLRLHATITPENASDKSVTWSSADEVIATVDGTGLVTGISEGEALIYVTTVDGGHKDSVEITVYTVDVEGVKIAAVDSIGVGQSLKLTATVTPENATDKSITWSSGNTSVATVSDNGLVTGVSAGEALIYVTTVDGGYKDSVAIKVYTEEVVPQPIPVTGVTIAGATDSLEVESTLQLTAVITPEDADNKTVTWSSSDDAVATVSEDGLVTGVAEGEAIITVTTEDGEFTASVTIAVYTEETPVVPKITGVAIKGNTSDTLHFHTHEDITKPDRGNTRQLTADVTIEPEGEVAYTVAWSSSDETVATVSEDGLVTAVAEGPVTITLTVTETATGDEFTDELTITITTVGIAPVPVTSVKAYIADNTLYVNSAVTEKVDIYTISGKLVYSAVKPAGEVQITLTTLSDGVLIIRGASGWVQKIVK
jgi:uncharacterized protein YjdB